MEGVRQERIRQGRESKGREKGRQHHASTRPLATKVLRLRLLANVVMNCEECTWGIGTGADCLLVSQTQSMVRVTPWGASTGA